MIKIVCTISGGKTSGFMAVYLAERYIVKFDYVVWLKFNIKQV